MSDPLSLAEEYARLNEAIRKAHEAIVDMRAERRLMAEQLAAITSTVEDLIEEAVASQVAKLGEATSAAMRDAIARVDQQIDRYLAIALGYDPETKRAGKLSIPALIERAKAVGALSPSDVSGRGAQENLR